MFLPSSSLLESESLLKVQVAWSFNRIHQVRQQHKNGRVTLDFATHFSYLLFWRILAATVLLTNRFRLLSFHNNNNNIGYLY